MNSFPVITRRWRSAIAGILLLLAACSVFAVEPAETPTAGLKGFVYLEPPEIRKEFLVKLRALDLNKDLPAELNQSSQEQVLQEVPKRRLTSPSSSRNWGWSRQEIKDRSSRSLKVVASRCGM